MKAITGIDVNGIKKKVKGNINADGQFNISDVVIIWMFLTFILLIGKQETYVRMKSSIRLICVLCFTCVACCYSSTALRDIYITAAQFLELLQQISHLRLNMDALLLPYFLL